MLKELVDEAAAVWLEVLPVIVGVSAVSEEAASVRELAA